MDSMTDPIRVDFLDASATTLRGRIGMTFAPGKTDWGASGLWERDLEVDLTRLREVYRTHVLISLVEDHELESLRISGLADAAAWHNISLVRFPIVDASVPDSAEATSRLISQILDAARKGSNVVIHCRGGLGRTGLIAACCLAALGWPGEQAIHLVRRARHGTVECASQETFVRSFAHAAGARQRPSSSPPIGRVRACLLAGAMGDALGYPVEFDRPGAMIAARWGARAPAKLDFSEPGRALISDDTQMTLFSAEGIIRANQARLHRGVASLPHAVQQAYLRWYRTQRFGASEPTAPCAPGWLSGVSALQQGRAPGNTCLSSLAAQAQRAFTPDVDHPPNDSKGCGAIMRAAPFGLAASSREQAFLDARDAGVLTHGHPSGYLSGAYFASLVFDLARGGGLSDALDRADALLSRERNHEEVARAVQGARVAARTGPLDAEAIERLGGGWVGEEALAIAVACTLTAGDDLREDLWRAAAHGGDSDSTASMTGNLLGAMRGTDALPNAWLEALELREVIDRVACDLFASAIVGCELDHESYPPWKD
jgi:ADP-ribosyl-[dinitrogen reductase] hydrolase